MVDVSTSRDQYLEVHLPNYISHSLHYNTGDILTLRLTIFVLEDVIQTSKMPATWISIPKWLKNIVELSTEL